MKPGIHPVWYPDARVTCACGNSWTTGSTKKEIHTDVCNKCHPFFTGEQRIVDTAGQVERFMKRMNAKEQIAATLPAVEEKRAKKEKRHERKAPLAGAVAPAAAVPAQLPLAVVEEKPAEPPVFAERPAPPVVEKTPEPPVVEETVQPSVAEEPPAPPQVQIAPEPEIVQEAGPIEASEEKAEELVVEPVAVVETPSELIVVEEVVAAEPMAEAKKGRARATKPAAKKPAVKKSAAAKASKPKAPAKKPAATKAKSSPAKKTKK